MYLLFAVHKYRRMERAREREREQKRKEQKLSLDKSEVARKTMNDCVCYWVLLLLLLMYDVCKYICFLLLLLCFRCVVRNAHVLFMCVCVFICDKPIKRTSKLHIPITHTHVFLFIWNIIIAGINSVHGYCLVLTVPILLNVRQSVIGRVQFHYFKCVIFVIQS